MVFKANEAPSFKPKINERAQKKKHLQTGSINRIRVGFYHHFIITIFQISFDNYRK